MAGLLMYQRVVLSTGGQAGGAGLRPGGGGLLPRWRLNRGCHGQPNSTALQLAPMANHARRGSITLHLPGLAQLGGAGIDGLQDRGVILGGQVAVGQQGIGPAL